MPPRRGIKLEKWECLSYNRAKEVVGLRRRRRLAAGGVLLLLLFLGLCVGERLWRALSAPAMAVLPALLLMAADAAGERLRPHALPLILAGGLLMALMAVALRSAGMETYLPYALAAALFLVKAGLFPRAQAQRRACAAWSAALVLAALYAGHPLFLGPERIARLRGVWTLSLFPLLLSCALASTCRPLLAKARAARAALLLAAFVLMTMHMSQVWLAWFVAYRDGAGCELAGAAVGLCRHQPLLLFALLELFVPAAMSYVKSSRAARGVQEAGIREQARQGGA